MVEPQAISHKPQATRVRVLRPLVACGLWLVAYATGRRPTVGEIRLEQLAGGRAADLGGRPGDVTLEDLRERGPRHADSLPSAGKAQRLLTRRLGRVRLLGDRSRW